MKKYEHIWLNIILSLYVIYFSLTYNEFIYGLMAIIVIQCFNVFTSRHVKLDIQKEMDKIDFPRLLLLILQQPILEEVFFRYALCNLLQFFFSIKVSWIIAAILFASIHIPNVYVVGSELKYLIKWQVLYCFCLGCTLGYLNHLGMSIVLHMVYNSTYKLICPIITKLFFPDPDITKQNQEAEEGEGEDECPTLESKPKIENLSPICCKSVTMPKRRLSLGDDLINVEYVDCFDKKVFNLKKNMVDKLVDIDVQRNFMGVIASIENNDKECLIENTTIRERKTIQCCNLSEEKIIKRT
jgi:membrane protease YdiL (CAAX protease family)